MGLPKILIVEDEAIFAADLRRRVLNFGYEVGWTTASAEHAMELVSNEDSVLALIDVCLEGEVDGIELASRLEKELHIPSVYITANTDDSTLARAKLTEPYGFLAKPVSDSELRSVLAIASYRKDAETSRRRMRKQAADLQEKKNLLEKMEFVARLSGGLAHQFNNALTSVTGHLQLMRADLELPEKFEENIDAALEESGRCTALVAQLLALSQQGSVFPEVVDLEHLLKESIRIAIPSLGAGVKVCFDTRGEFLIKVDRRQIQQVIVQLLVNASNAMPEGGSAHLSLFRKSFAREELQELDREARSFIVLRIQDEGMGIAPENIRKIFEPFYSSKELTEGLGLGLAAVWGAMKACGGWISVDSEPGEGATFQLYFPEVATE